MAKLGADGDSDQTPRCVQQRFRTTARELAAFFLDLDLDRTVPQNDHF